MTTLYACLCVGILAFAAGWVSCGIFMLSLDNDENETEEDHES